MTRHLLLLLCTLAVLAGPAAASGEGDALNPDLQVRIGSALLAGDPVRPALLADLPAGEDRQAMTVVWLGNDAEATAAPALPARDVATLDLKTSTPFTPYLGAGAPDEESVYRLQAGVDCALDASTVLNVAVGGSVPDDGGMVQTLTDTLSADFEDHNLSVGLKVAF